MAMRPSSRIWGDSDSTSQVPKILGYPAFPGTGPWWTSWRREGEADYNRGHLQLWSEPGSPPATTLYQMYSLWVNDQGNVEPSCPYPMGW